MALFDGTNDPRADLETLAAATREALAATRFEDRFNRLFELVSDGVAWRMVRHLRARKIPTAALALAGGAGAIAIGKPYAVRPAWNASMALSRGCPPHREVRGISELESKIDGAQARMRDATDAARYAEEEDLVSVACAERWVAELLARRDAEEDPGVRASIEARLEDARWELEDALGRASKNAPDPLLVRVAQRVAPIGAGGSSLSICADDRVALYEGRRSGPAWEGLLLVIDACAGGSHAALEALGRFARTHESLGWPLWLDEVACAFVEHPRRAECERRLDAQLAVDPCARNLFELYREKLESNLASARDVWLTLAARREAPVDAPDELMRTIAEERAKRDAGLPGRLDPKYFRMVERTIEASLRESRLEEERNGPFYDLRIDPELEQAFDGPLFYLFAGFRTLHGAELAREALAALAN